MSEFIMLKNVRVSFPHLFEAPVINGEEGKCGATLLLHEEDHADEISRIQSEIDDICKAKWKGKKLPAEKLCLRLGEDKRDEYVGYYALSANSKQAIVVLDANRNLVTDPKKNQIYAGCYVNAKISLWAQDNSFGKRVNCNLVAIQFAADGEPLDGTYVSPDTAMEGFDAVANDSFLD